MGSQPTLDHPDQTRNDGSIHPAAQAFARLNPGHAWLVDPDDDDRRHQQRMLEDHDLRGFRVWAAETQENTPQATASQRATAIRFRALEGHWNEDVLFDWLNPDFGVPADQRNPIGRQDLRDREAALALGTRVTVATSRENDRDPVMWVGGQDYRAADAARNARLDLARGRRGPERTGPER